MAAALNRFLTTPGPALVAVWFAISAPTLADDVRVHQLESEVNRLQRDLDVQSRRIDDLERAARNSRVAGASMSAHDASDSSPAWLIGTNWDQVRPGMKVLDVIALLGRPTSVRSDSDGEISELFYAMELGPTAVLTGNVQLSDSGVTQINKPALR